MVSTEAEVPQSFGWLFAACLLFLGIALALALHTAHRLATGNTAQARVASVSYSLGKKRDSVREYLTFDVIVAFRAGGENVQVRKSADFFERFHEGDPVPVIYSASNPSHVTIGTFWQLWGSPIEFLGLAIAVAFTRVAVQHDGLRRLFTA